MNLKILSEKLYPTFIKNFPADSVCKLFLAASDMKTRAVVRNAQANSAADAWNIALEDLKKILAEKNINPKILRADWVTSSEKMSWEDFNKLLGETRRNYFRRGLALDADYKIAFTEQEMNANYMLYKDGKEGSKFCIFREKNSNDYCQMRFGCDFPAPENSSSVEIFETCGAFVQEDEEPKIITGKNIYAGRRDVSVIDEETFMKLAKNGANYLARQVQKSGRFIYGRYPCFNRKVPSYNTLRHFSSVFAMLDVYGAYKKMPPMKLGKAIVNAMDYAIKNFIKYRKLDDGTEAAYPEDKISKEIKLGSNGVSILGLVKYTELMHTKKYLPLMNALANGILSMQNDDGSFVHVLNSEDFSVKEPFRIVYYDGEAVFGMMRLYSITKDEKLLKASELAFKRFIATNHWQNHDHWLSYAVNELTQWQPDAKYFEFGINNFLSFLPFIYHRDTQFPTLMELMMAADTMLERMKTMPEMSKLLMRVDLNDFYATMEKRAENLLNGYFWPELAMYYAEPESIVGSFFIRHHAFRVRIDDVEHFLSAFIAYCRYLERRKNLPAPIPSQKLLQGRAEGTGLFNIQSTVEPIVEKFSIIQTEAEKKIPEPVIEEKKIVFDENNSTMRGLTETMLKVLQFLGIDAPAQKDIKAPSDFLGENFSLSQSVQDNLRKALRINKENFAHLYEVFKEYYHTQKPLKQDETDINIYFCDYLLFSMNNGYDVKDYFDYEFYNKPLELQKSFIGGIYRRKHNRVGNEKFSVRFMARKGYCNRIFDEFIRRDWLYPPQSTLREFKNFIAVHPKFFAKNNVGGGGTGAEVIQIDENSNVEEIFARLKKDDKIIEEIISQHEIMNEFCPDTLNTVRINTFIDIHNVVHILTASGRFGRVGALVDNFTSGGMTVTIDPKTGVIISDGLSKVHERLAYHPDTGKKFKGFQYPFWETIRKTIIKMAKIVPAMRHVGWDICINADGKIDLVEANDAPGTAIQQAADSIGRLNLYNDLVSELENYQREEMNLLGWRVNNLRRFNSDYKSDANRRRLTVPAIMKKIIPDCESLMDLGCRENKIAENLCNENIKYFPVDSKKHDEKVLQFDFNKGEFPALKADTCLCAMTAEYVAELPKFLEKVCAAAQKQILFVCRPFDKETRPRERWHHSPMVDFTEDFLIQTVTKNNFKLDSAERFSENSPFVLYDFRKVAEKKNDDLTDDKKNIYGLSDGVFKACEFLGLEFPQTTENISEHSPSDYFGENFELDEDTKNKLRQAANLSQEDFNLSYRVFKVTYFANKSIKHNETDLNIYFCDYVLFVRGEGYNVSNYLNFEFYKKSAEERKTFVGQRYLLKMHVVCNDYTRWHLLQNKSTSNRLFAKFIHRDWINPKKCDLKEFKSFVKKHPRFFVKANDGFGGKEAKIVQVTEDFNFEEMFEQFKADDFLLEEIISQHESLNEFCPDTLNTLRINTLIDAHEKIHIVTACGRFGRIGKAVDNFTSGGFSVVVDPKTGVITSNAMNKNHEIIECHPDTGKIFKGFQYPAWEKIRAAVKQMARVIPGLRHVGWDIAINSNGEPEFVEGNADPGANLYQAADSIGKLPLYEPLITELEEQQKKDLQVLGYRVSNRKKYRTAYNSKAPEHEAGVKFAMKNLISNCESLIDLGCRENLFAKNICPAEVKYFPVDYKKHNKETIKCDFNKEEFPEITADTCLCSFTAEYVSALPQFLKNICAAAKKQILMVCSPIDKENNMRYRWRHPLLTDFTEKFLIDSIEQENFKLNSAEPLPDNPSIYLYDFRKNSESLQKVSEVEIKAEPKKNIYGLSEGVIKACKFFGLNLPPESEIKSPNEIHKPSDYFGKNFEIDLETLDKLQKASKLSKEKFAQTYGRFTRKFFSQKSLNPNETDLHIYFCDYILYAKKLGAMLVDYFDFEFYNKSVEQQKTFRMQKHREATRGICNPPKARELLNNKSLTNELFADFIYRDWINTQKCSFEEFKNFVEKNPRFFSKPIIGSLGKGAQIIQVAENENLGELFETLKNKKRLLEGVISQHESLNEFCPDTVNTLRVNTLLDAHNAVHILTTGGRFGRMGRVVDNFHGGGFSVIINPKTGIITSDGINRVHERSPIHPDTGKTFKGFKYPAWEKICRTIKRMARVIPQMRHVGWDIAINSNGDAELVEANGNPDVDVQQAADSVGRLYLYTPLIDELKTYKKNRLKVLGYRFNDLKNFNESYENEQGRKDSRLAVAMKKIIPECKSLADIGCRKSKFVKSICPAEIKYFPVDYQKHDEEIIDSNFIEGELPEITADTILCAFTAEYVSALPQFLKNICAAAQKQILIMSRPFDREKHINYRCENPFLTDFTEEFLIKTIEENNFTLQASEPFSDNPSVILYDFRKN